MLINVYGKKVEIMTSMCSKNNIPAKLPGKPFINIYVKVTNRCNANCAFCAFKGTEQYTFDIDKYVSALHEIKRTCRINKVSFTGGEPTVEADLLGRLIKLTRKILGKWVFIVVSTNGSNLECLSHMYDINNVALSRHHYNDSINREIFHTNKVPTKIDIINSRLGRHKIHLSCVLAKNAINSGHEVIRYLEFARNILINDVGFVGLMTDVNAFCKKNYVNFDKLSLVPAVGERGKVAKTKDYTRGNDKDCACSNYMFIKNGEVVHFYYRHRIKTSSIESFFFDGQHLRAGFNGEIIQP